MIRLINRGKYDTATQEEFEHLIQRLSGFLAQIFDEDGVLIPPSEGGSNSVFSVSNIEAIHHGNLSINNGSLTGQSVLPTAFVPPRSIVLSRGYLPGGNETAFPHMTLTSDGERVTAKRNADIGNGILEYTVIRFKEVSDAATPRRSRRTQFGAQ